MDTEQQLENLLTAFCDNASLSQIDLLATESLLRDGKRALPWALEHHNDPEVIKLLIRRHPLVLASVMRGEPVWEWFDSVPPEDRFSNHDEIYDLLLDCDIALKDHRFSDLIELCGTSDALEALVAAHSEDDLPLHVLCFRESWDKVLARTKLRPTQATVNELFFQDELGRTSFAVAAGNEAPCLLVLESMILLGKLDTKKRNILAIAAIDLSLPLHHTARRLPDPAAIKLLVRHHPQALLAKDRDDDTPLTCAIQCNENPAVVTLLRELTTARRATIALRTSLLLCIKAGYVYPRRRDHGLDTELAFSMLNDNVWSHVMAFL